MRKYTGNIFIIISAAFLLITIIILFFLHYNALNQTQTYSDWDERTNKIIDISNSLTITLLDAENSSKGFILIGDNEFLETFYSSNEKVFAYLVTLKGLTKDYATQQARLNSISKLCEEQFCYLNESVSLKLANKFNQAKQTVKEEQQIHVTEQLRSEINKFNEEEEKLLKERIEKTDKETEFSFLILLIGASIIITIVALLFIKLIREVIIRKKMQAELFISREWFFKTLISIGDGVIVTDVNGIVTLMNKIAENLTGRSMEEAKDKSIEIICDLKNGTTHLTVENPIREALKENKIVILTNNTIMVKQDGTSCFIDDSAAPIHNDNGEIIGAVLIFRDITEQYHNRKRLLESEERLRNIINNTGSIISILNPDNKLIMINRQCEKIFNIISEDVIGKDVADCFPKEMTANLIIRNGAIFKELIELEQIIEHSDGTNHTYHTAKFPLYDIEKNIYAVCNVSTDITESQKNIEMKEKLAVQDILLKTELKYSELTENMPNIFFSLNHSLEYIHWNKTCEKFTGIKADEVIGKFVSGIFTEFNNIDILQSYKEVLETGVLKSFIMNLEFKEDKYIFYVTIYPAVTGISVLMTDITIQKQTEQEVFQMIQNLQKNNRDLRQFAYIVSHNLRAPIANIKGLVDLYDTEDDEEFNKGLLGNVRSEIYSLDDIVMDINAIISVRDQDSVVKEHVNFEKEFNRVKQILEKEIIGSQALIVADFKTPKEIISIKSYIHSILYNLISNAIKFRSPDKPLRIDIKTEQQGNYVILSIKDNGLGINLERNSDKIFGLYKRFHGADIQGKGMGLHMVKTEAESLGGRVEVESEVNEGTLFKVFLPKFNKIITNGKN